MRFLWLVAGLLVACNPDEDGTDDPKTPTGTTPVDTGPGDTGIDGADFCGEAPVSTYANFGRGFLTQHCQACHASTAPDRHDAPPNVTFDTEQEALSLTDRILARAASEEPTMPPQGGVSDDDRYRLEVWLTCGD